ncbi:IS481 family transposase [Actinomyces radicidentis]|uniref:IS481 family transposase n=1 Tax=Actinomyces radicidentis TaxID=111015 RepID=UPI0026E0D0F5|nr:IS481 family transposase [Actinomyces radicidentis]
MTHRNAPLTPEGRLRLIERVQAGRPIAHVAAEAGIARATVSKWVARYRIHGEAGLQDRSSAPWHRPTQTPPEVVDLIETWRRTHKWSARRITHELHARGTEISVRTVTRWLDRAGLNRRRHIDPTGASNRVTGRIHARFPGHMVHLDVKKVGRIPPGGGWRAHGRGSDKAKASKRGAGRRVGYTYLHTAIDGFSRLAYTQALDDETAATTIGFFCRARAFFASHGITRLVRVITDNGVNYRAKSFTKAVLSLAVRHQRIRPYTPRHNGKVERYNRILSEECLYASQFISEDQRRAAIAVWNHHYNYHRPHTACHDQPPATRVPARVTNVMTSYS